MCSHAGRRHRVNENRIKNHANGERKSLVDTGGWSILGIASPICLKVSGALSTLQKRFDFDCVYTYGAPSPWICSTKLESSSIGINMGKVQLFAKSSTFGNIPWKAWFWLFKIEFWWSITLYWWTVCIIISFTLQTEPGPNARRQFDTCFIMHVLYRMDVS